MENTESIGCFTCRFTPEVNKSLADTPPGQVVHISAVCGRGCVNYSAWKPIGATELERLQLENEGLTLVNKRLEAIIDQLIARVVELRATVPDLAKIVGDK